MSKKSFAAEIAEMRKKAEDGTNRKEETELLADIEKIRAARAKGEDVEAGSEQESQNEQADENTKRVTQATEKATEEQARTSEDDSKQAVEREQKASDGDESLTVSEQLDLFQKELELRDVKLEKIEARAQKWETLAQRRAGELGHLRQELGSGRGQQKADTASNDDQEDIWAELNDETATEDKRSPSQTTVPLNEFEEEALVAARQRTLSDFLNSHEDLYVEKDGEKALDPAFTKVISSVREDYVDELASRSPRRVRQATASLLREARATYREQKLEGSIAEARQKRAIVSTKARERKQAMEVSESSAPAKAKETSKSFEEMTPDEQRKVLASDKKRSIYRVF